MSYKFVVPTMLSLSLGGCVWTVHNSDEAYRELPTLPEKPDGICPDVKGVYPRLVWSEATESCRGEFVLREKMFGNVVREMKNIQLGEIKPVNLGLFPAVERFTENYAFRVEPKHHCGGFFADARDKGAVLSFEPIEGNMLKLAVIYPEGEVRSVSFVQNELKLQQSFSPWGRWKSVCNKGKYYSHSYGGQGQAPAMDNLTADVIHIVSKGEGEEIVVKRYFWGYGTFLFKLLPGIKVKEVTTYRFPQISNEPIKFEIPGAMQ